MRHGFGQGVVDPQRSTIAPSAEVTWRMGGESQQVHIDQLHLATAFVVGQRDAVAEVLWLGLGLGFLLFDMLARYLPAHAGAVKGAGHGLFRLVIGGVLECVIGRHTAAKGEVRTAGIACSGDHPLLGGVADPGAGRQKR
ncbi:hypothetical protein FQZ97_919340 [compost metagenome]